MRRAGFVLGMLLLAACSAAPAPTPHPTLPATRAPTAMPSPSPRALLSFPPTTGVVLAPGRYSSQPPFDVAFSFEIPGTGWGTAHHHGEFFDVIQPARAGVKPTRWVAFARPQTIHGTGRGATAGLSAEQVVAAFESRGDIELSAAQPYTIGGRKGLIIDMSTDQSGVKPFGGPAGDMELDPDYEVRMIIVGHDGAPLLVLAFAPRGEMAQAWADSQPIIDSIEL